MEKATKHPLKNKQPSLLLHEPGIQQDLHFQQLGFPSKSTGKNRQSTKACCLLAKVCTANQDFSIYFLISTVDLRLGLEFALTQREWLVNFFEPSNLF